jgi:hypothetical protein
MTLAIFKCPWNLCGTRQPQPSALWSVVGARLVGLRGQALSLLPLGQVAPTESLLHVSHHPFVVE